MRIKNAFVVLQAQERLLRDSLNQQRETWKKMRFHSSCHFLMVMVTPFSLRARRPLQTAVSFVFQESLPFLITVIFWIGIGISVYTLNIFLFLHFLTWSPVCTPKTMAIPILSIRYLSASKYHIPLKRRTPWRIYLFMVGDRICSGQSWVILSFLGSKKTTEKLLSPVKELRSQSEYTLTG